MINRFSASSYTTSLTTVSKLGFDLRRAKAGERVP